MAKNDQKNGYYTKFTNFDTSKRRRMMKFYRDNPDTLKFVPTKFQKNRAMRLAVTLFHSKNIVIRDGHAYFRDVLLP